MFGLIYETSRSQKIYVRHGTYRTVRFNLDYHNIKNSMNERTNVPLVSTLPCILCFYHDNYCNFMMLKKGFYLRATISTNKTSIVDYPNSNIYTSFCHFIVYAYLK